MLRSRIRAAHPARHGRWLSFSFPASQLGEPLADILQRHGIAAAMAAVIVIATCCSEGRAQPTAVPHVADNGPAKPVSAFIVEASHRFGIPALWIRSVIDVESAGNLRAVSPKGAMGLMQIMPETWAGLRQRYSLGADPYDAHDNITAGTAYLRELHDRYGSPGFLAAYNAGPVRWEDHLTTGKPLPLEARDFLARLAPIARGDAIGDASQRVSMARSWTCASLFPKQSTRAVNANQQASDLQALPSTNIPPARDRTAFAAQSNGLFVVMMSSGQSQ